MGMSSRFRTFAKDFINGRYQIAGVSGGVADVYYRVIPDTVTVNNIQSDFAQMYLPTSSNEVNITQFNWVSEPATGNDMAYYGGRLKNTSVPGVNSESVDLLGYFLPSKPPTIPLNTSSRKMYMVTDYLYGFEAEETTIQGDYVRFDAIDFIPVYSVDKRTNRYTVAWINALCSDAVTRRIPLLLWAFAFGGFHPVLNELYPMLTLYIAKFYNYVKVLYWSSDSVYIYVPADRYDEFIRDVWNDVGIPFAANEDELLNKPQSEWTAGYIPNGFPITTTVVEGEGTIAAPSSAEEHDKVDFTVTPAEGYKIRTVYVKTTEGTRPVPLNGSAADSTTERTFSFPMPAEAVTIYAKFTNGDEPTGDGGDGEQDDATVDVPTAVPAIDVENQVVRNYLVNKANLAKLAQALTKVDLEDGTGKRKFPISVYNYILAIRAYPINPLTHDAHHLTTVNNFVINGIDLGIEEFEGYYPSSGYNYVVRLGSIDVKGYYGNYMDYSPMTKYQLYLPYLGFVDLDGSLIVGKTLSVDYAYNYNDGDFMARIYTGTEDTRSCILTKMGSFTARLPVTAVDATNAINQRDGASMRGLAAAGAIGLALAGTIITAGSAPATLAGAAAISKSALVFGVTTAGGLATIYDAVRNYNDAGRNVQYSRSGDLSGFMAFYAPQKCYLYIDRPESAEPDDFVKYRGYRSEKTVKIGDLTGYTKIRDVILDGIDLTVGEKAELLTALKNGVII